MANKKEKYVSFIKENSEVLFFSGLICIGAATVLVWLALMGNQAQVFKDVVNEYTSMDGSNKSAERNMVFCLSIVGSICIAIFYLIRGRNYFSPRKVLSPDDGFRQKNLLVMGLVYFLTYYFCYGQTHPFLIGSVAFMLLLFAVGRSTVTERMISFASCIYAGCAIYRIYVYFGGSKSVGLISIILIAFLLSILFLLTEKWAKIFMVIQLFLPFLLLMFLSSEYMYEGNITTVKVPARISLFIWLLIIVFIWQAISKIKKYWVSTDISSIISYGTLVSILSFNHYSGTGAIISTDTHHPFENIIGFSEIVEVGQKPFSEYIPVSGMYSFVHGFFLWLFGGDKFAYYSVTENIFYLLIIMVIAALLIRMVDGTRAFAIVLIYPFIVYNRVAFVLPIMLLLAFPKLIEQKNAWLKAWFLSSLFQGLYYPVFGAAVCVGYLPLGIWQIITYVKAETMKKDIRTARFWVEWLCCVLLAVLVFPLLWGTLRHMMAMGGQTVYADGISRFGQAVDETFFPYIQAMGLRLALYDLFTFLIIIAGIWVSVAIGLKVGRVHIEQHRLKMEKPEAVFVSFALAIALLISCSYTLVRIDINSIYARSSGVVYAMAVMLLVIQEWYFKQEKARYWLAGFAVFLIAAVPSTNFLSIDWSEKLAAYYTVPEGYVYVTDSQIPKLGICFVEQSERDYLTDWYNDSQNLDSDRAYLGAGNFGWYYFCGIKGDSTMESGTIKGYGAASETVKLMRRNGTIVKGVDAYNNYYFYHWLLTSGEYKWSDGDRAFYPNDDTDRENILLQNKTIDVSIDGLDMGRTASSWGASFASLENIFSKADVEYGQVMTDLSVKIKTDEPFDGDRADFLYLDFPNMDENYQYILFNHSEDKVFESPHFFEKFLMKKDYNRGMSVVVKWNDEQNNPHTMQCGMGRGKLLIPLGAGRGWLLNSHSEIEIEVLKDGELMEVPELYELKFLKLGEVKEK